MMGQLLQTMRRRWASLRQRKRRAPAPRARAPRVEMVEDRCLLSDVAGLNSSGNVSSGNVSSGNVSSGNVSSGNVSSGNVSRGNVSRGNVSSGNVSVQDTSSNAVNGGYVDLGEIRYDSKTSLGADFNIKFELPSELVRDLLAAGLSPATIYGYANGQDVDDAFHGHAMGSLDFSVQGQPVTAPDVDDAPHLEVSRPQTTMLTQLPSASLPRVELASELAVSRDSSEIAAEMEDVERVARTPVLATVQQLAAISSQADVPAGLINLPHQPDRPAATVSKSPLTRPSLRGRAGASQSFEVAVHSAHAPTSPPIARTGSLAAKAASDRLPLDETIRLASVFAALPATAVPGEAEQRQQAEPERPADSTPGQGGERLPEAAGFALTIRKAASTARDAIFADGGFLDHLLQPETGILLTALTAQLLVDPRKDDTEEKKNLRDALRWRRRLKTGQR